eukprot:109725-Alexandrium_andersonii.AAC.1
MSASLVGSEMCIRDRPCGGAPASKCWTPLGLLRPRAGGLCAGPGVLGSVSYTHLTLPTICSV